MTADEIARKFQEKRRRANWCGYPLMVAGFGCFILAVKFFDSMDAVILIAIAGWAVGLVGLLIVCSFTRCPACNALPMVWTADGSTGTLLDPTECPKCRARLK